MENDHDLLIELRTMFKMAHEENQRGLTAHQHEDAKALAELDIKINAAHTRMDKMKVEMVDALETLTTKVEGFVSIKDKVVGGAAVLAFLFSAVVSVITLLKK